MKKRILALLLSAVLLTWLMAACGAGSSAPAEEESSESQTETAPAAEEEAAPEKTEEEQPEAEEVPEKEEPAAEPEEAAEEQPAAAVTALHGSVGKTEQDEYSEEDGSMILASCWPSLSLEEEDAAQYADLQASLTMLSMEYAADIQETVEEYHDDAVEYHQEAGSDSFYAFEAASSFRRLDSSFTSVLTLSYSYSGGAHPYYAYTGSNYNSATGQKMSLTDVITDMDAFYNTVSDLLLSTHDAEEFFSTDFSDVLNDENAEYLTWVLEPESLTLIFNPYEIAPYASGTITVTLGYADYPTLFALDFTAPDYWAVDLSISASGMPYMTDLDGDGQLNTLRLYTEYEDMESGWLYEVIVIDTDEYYDEDNIGYSTTPVLMHTPDGEYLYIDTLQDSDCTQFSVWDLSSRSAVNVEDNWLGWAESWEEETGTVWTSAVTDPTSFKMDIRIHPFVSSNAWKRYTVTEDGSPAALDDWFTVSYPHELTLLKDISAETVSEDGTVTGDTTLSEGTVITIVRTDNANWVDCSLQDGSLQDGSLVRIQVDLSQWPRMVDGMDEEEVFSGIMYAG